MSEQVLFERKGTSFAVLHLVLNMSVHVELTDWKSALQHQSYRAAPVGREGLVMHHAPSWNLYGLFNLLFFFLFFIVASFIPGGSKRRPSPQTTSDRGEIKKLGFS